jgi:hypothetical protein
MASPGLARLERRGWPLGMAAARLLRRAFLTRRRMRAEAAAAAVASVMAALMARSLGPTTWPLGNSDLEAGWRVAIAGCVIVFVVWDSSDARPANMGP